MVPIWRVRMLGGLRADSEDVSVTRFRTRRVGLLLATLAYHRERSYTREELADMLWPDLEPERARHNLRQALSSLRHHLEPPGIPAGAVLDTKGPRVSLNPDTVATDVDDFERALKTGRSSEDSAKAIELYRGDLLPGFYEDWVRQERLRLEDEYVAALQACARAAESDERIEDAIRYVRLAITKDELREELHANLIRLYIAAGRPSSARAHYEEWRSLSLEHLDEPPSAELRRMVEDLRVANPTPPTEAKSDLPASLEKKLEDAGPTVRLPIQLTRFFGRTDELERTIEKFTLGQARLVTLTGPAGTGKTRLSVEVGKTLNGRHGWNVWFVSLADISEGSGLLDAALAATKGVADATDPLTSLCDRLTEPNSLLILDNLEHILGEAVPVVAALLEKASKVSLLVTSRQALKLGGEEQVDLATLPVPSVEDETLTTLAAVPSVGLFVDRARSVLPDFALTAHNARSIGEICRKLDGLPLALEIAASLSGAFSPSQLLQNLENRLELLRSRRRDLTSRHQSLRAAIDYSYNLLDEDLQAFFVHLSVFRGGFTVGAAREVCIPEPDRFRDSDTLRLILDLQERSLLRADESREGAPARFRLLESYREYAAEQLDQTGSNDLRQSHADYFVRQCAVDRPAEDRENRLAAVRFLLEIGSVHDCVTLLLSFGAFTTVTRDAIQSLARDRDFESFDPADKVRILRMATDAHVHRSDFAEALRTSQRAAEMAEAEGLDQELMLANRKKALVLAYLGRREESIAQSERNLEEGQRLGDLQTVEFAYTNIGANRWSMGDLKAARDAYEGAYAASLELRDGKPYWAVLYSLSLANLDLNCLDEGLRLANEGIRAAQDEDEAFGVSMCLALVSRYHRYKGNLSAALATSYEALVRRRKVGFLYWNLQAIFAHAVVLTEMGLLREATTLLASSRAIARVDDREAAALRERLHAALPEADFERAWADGLGMSPDEAFRLAVTFR